MKTKFKYISEGTLNKTYEYSEQLLEFGRKIKWI